MKRIHFFRITVLSSLLLVFSAAMIYSETIEQTLLMKKKQMKFKAYEFRAKADNRDDKLALLDEILNDFNDAEENNKDKPYDENDARLIDVVEYLAGEGSLRKQYENNLLINNFPDVRRKSVQVLGNIGGERVRDLLITIILNDPNSSVKAEVCLALEKVGDDQKGEALRALIYVYRNTYKPDPNFVFAVINTVRKIARSTSSSYADAIYLLSEIQLGNYNRKIREAAYDAIQELSYAEAEALGKGEGK